MTSLLIQRCTIRNQSLLGISMVVRTHANACQRFFLPPCRFYPFAWVSMVFEQVYQMSNVWMPFKRVNTSNLMTFECCFLISKIMRIAMQCHPSLYYVMYLGTISFVVQFIVFISLLFLFIVYYLALWFLFIVYYRFLVIQQIMNTVSLLKFQ